MDTLLEREPGRLFWFADEWQVRRLVCNGCRRELRLLVDPWPQMRQRPTGGIEFVGAFPYCDRCLEKRTPPADRHKLAAILDLAVVTYARAQLRGSISTVYLSRLPVIEGFVLSGLFVVVDGPATRRGAWIGQEKGTLFPLFLQAISAFAVPGYCEADYRWNPANPPMRVVGKFERPSDHEAVAQGMQVLREYDRPNLGRRPRTGWYPTREIFAQALKEAATEVRNDDYLPTPDLIVDKLLVGRRQMYTLLNKYGLLDFFNELLRSRNRTKTHHTPHHGR